MKKKIDIKILRSQSQACIYAIKNVLPIVFNQQKPADRIMASFFKNNRKYGSRDRKIIYELIFSIFRWYGWIKILIPEIDKIFDKTEFTKKHDIIIYKIAFAASLLDNNKNIPATLINIWKSEIQITKYYPQATEKIYNSKFIPDLEIIDFLRQEFKLNKKLKLDRLVPEWFQNELPDSIDLRRLIGWYQSRPPIWLRTNSLNNKYLANELTKNEINFSFSELIKEAICINESRVNLYSLESYNKGIIEVQDLASQIIGLVSNPKEGERWWDACAGAGGKSLQLSSIMKNKGRIVATDIRAYKLDDLKKRAKRAKRANIECKEWDGKALRSNKRYKYDGVLVDAPCTCSGTWRRNPDARWRLSDSEPDEMSNLQMKILQNAATGVKPNGTLIYATCSVLKKENLDLVKKFLLNNKNFIMEPFINPLTENKTKGYLQVYPWDGNCDAMFVAKFRKNK
ncbi:MAG TPA: RsmB/NOP family class I SAM-dependent RNA methyltransferase [Victivallales bacterium]|nr:RsmB/NOP family class I SAM-dependent RNA methyltransferase [Victivallales bacterium]